MPTKLPGLMSATVTGATSATAQLSASLIVAVAPSRVAMVTVLPSMAEIVPRTRVGVPCAIAVAADRNATDATTRPAKRRTDFMAHLPGKQQGPWHGSPSSTDYDCVS